MELSEEMQEALRILREDGQIKAFNSLTESNKAVIARMDEMEKKREEERQSTPIPDPTPSNPNDPGSTEPDEPTGPTPPPVVEPAALPTDEKPKRKSWWENYPS